MKKQHRRKGLSSKTSPAMPTFKLQVTRRQSKNYFADWWT